MSDNTLMVEIRNKPPMAVKADWRCVEVYQTLYDDITGNGVVLKFVDRHALGELAVTMVEMQDLRATLAVEGESKEVQGDRNMITKRNPARDALEKLRSPMLRLMKEFQMTPGSRGKTFSVGGVNQKVNDGFDEV
jgi:phage terminase small subunit